MNPVKLLLFLVFPVFLNAQTKTKVQVKKNIDSSLVSKIFICKPFKKPILINDSVSVASYKYLSPEQTVYFINQWNSSNYIGKLKTKPKYFFDIRFKDGSMRSIGLNGNLTESNNYYYQPQDSKFFETIWKQATILK